MGLPMNRHSKHRSRTRRAHLALAAAGTSVCEKCQSPKMPHRVCTVCGTYNGRQVLNVDKTVEKKLAKAPTAKVAKAATKKEAK